MARMPGTNWQGEHGSRLMARYDATCYHTIVGFAPAHAAHFSVHHDGRIDQSRDTKYQSAANLEGNHRIIAIENEDHGPGFPDWSGSNVPHLTPAQVVANARILRWTHEEHGIRLQLCPDSRPTSEGLAYHRQGIDGNFTGPYQGRVPGGEVWTQHFGKVCPGDNRIDQRHEILRIAIGAPRPPEDEMTAEDVAAITTYIDQNIRPYLVTATGTAGAIFVDNRDGTLTWCDSPAMVSAAVNHGVLSKGFRADGYPIPYERSRTALGALRIVGPVPEGWE